MTFGKKLSGVATGPIKIKIEVGWTEGRTMWTTVHFPEGIVSALQREDSRAQAFVGESVVKALLEIVTTNNHRQAAPSGEPVRST